MAHGMHAWCAAAQCYCSNGGVRRAVQSAVVQCTVWQCACALHGRCTVHSVTVQSVQCAVRISTAVAAVRSAVAAVQAVHVHLASAACAAQYLQFVVHGVQSVCRSSESSASLCLSSASPLPLLCLSLPPPPPPLSLSVVGPAVGRIVTVPALHI
jgi:hypothetical protein